MSQTDLANRLQIDAMVISNIETNKVMPTPELAREISSILGVDMNVIFPDMKKDEKQC